MADIITRVKYTKYTIYCAHTFAIWITSTVKRECRKRNRVLSAVQCDALRRIYTIFPGTLTILFATGMGMPLNHYMFHGALRVLHPVGWAAIGLKLTAIFWMMWIMGLIFFGLNPRLRELFAGFAAGKAPDPAAEKELFEIRARRKALCETCLKLAVVVLVSSAFIGFAP